MLRDTNTSVVDQSGFVIPRRLPFRSMKPKLVNRGVYDAQEVALLLGRVSVDTIIRWSAPNSAGQSAVVSPSLTTAFSFVDLVSLSVAVKLYERGVSDRHLRQGVSELTKRVGSATPFSRRDVLARVATSGTAFLWNEDGEWIDLGTGGQGTFKDIVVLYLKTVDFDPTGIAARWRPTLHVVLDPRVQAGAPVVEGTRVPTATIAELAEDQSLDEIAKEYDLPLAKVKAAVAFEATLRAGAGIAA